MAASDQSPNLSSALQQLVEHQYAEPTKQAVSGYGPRPAAVALTVFLAVSVLLQSEALVEWTRQWEPSARQAVAQGITSGLNQLTSAVGLVWPRRLIDSASSAAAEAVGLKSTDDWGRVEAFAGAEAVGTEAEPLADPLDDIDLPPLPAPESSESEPTAGPPPSNDSLGTVLLAGDSLIAGGLATALSRTLARRGDLRAVHAFRIGSGLSHPELFDWAAEVPPLIAREDPRLVICSLGANDAVAIRDGDKVLRFGDPEWKREYQRRVIALMRALSGQGARVLWLGLPPMRDQRFSRRAEVLNRLFSEAADRVPRVEYLEVGMLLSGPDQQYATFGKRSDGQRAKLRLDDGIHYSPAGARAIARWVMDWVRERFPRQAGKRG